jgi:hypothetical protein
VLAGCLGFVHGGVEGRVVEGGLRGVLPVGLELADVGAAEDDHAAEVKPHFEGDGVTSFRVVEGHGGDLVREFEQDSVGHVSSAGGMLVERGSEPGARTMVRR